MGSRDGLGEPCADVRAPATGSQRVDAEARRHANQPCLGWSGAIGRVLEPSEEGVLHYVVCICGAARETIREPPQATTLRQRLTPHVGCAADGRRRGPRRRPP